MYEREIRTQSAHSVLFQMKNPELFKMTLLQSLTDRVTSTNYFTVQKKIMREEGVCSVFGTTDFQCSTSFKPQGRWRETLRTTVKLGE